MKSLLLCSLLPWQQREQIAFIHFNRNTLADPRTGEVTGHPAVRYALDRHDFAGASL